MKKRDHFLYRIRYLFIFKRKSFLLTCFLILLPIPFIDWYAFPILLIFITVGAMYSDLLLRESEKSRKKK